MKLNEIPIGRRARVIAYQPGSKTYRQKCLSMGLTPGVELTVLGVAPLGCPIEIQVRGYCLSLRATESQVIDCELL